MKNENCWRHTFIRKDYRPVLKGTKLRRCRKHFKSEHFRRHINYIEKLSIVISARDDDSQWVVIQRYTSTKNLIFLDYDSFGKDWTFSFDGKDLYFYIGKRIISPRGIYIRPFFSNKPGELQNSYFHIAHAIDMWDGPVVGTNMESSHNGSKVYQQITTIQKAAAGNKVLTPPSYFIKGSLKKVKELLKKHGELIVKSASGIRSRVVNQDDFLSWDSKSLSYLPVLFQKRISGRDVRVHVIENEILAVEVKEKDGVDFRYVERSDFSRRKLSTEENKFCKCLATEEKLSLVGIDLLVDSDKFYCLECNPSPGWALFHANTRDEVNLVKKLCNKIGAYETSNL